jgi:hypothetical protein
MPDVRGWSIDEIEAWEEANHEFATEERMNAAIAANAPTAEDDAETDKWKKYYDEEARHEDSDS